MNFVGLFKHEHAVEKAGADHESGASDSALQELSSPPLQDEPDFGMELEEALAEALAIPAEAPEDAVAEHRITPHSQSRMAALSAFEELTQSTRQDLQALGLTLAKVTSTHQLMRGFLTGIHTDIHRANEMELSHSRLTAENRKLSHQLDEANKHLSAREASNEALENRVARLMHEAASLRGALSEARLEAGEAANSIANLEAERAELMTSLAGKSLGVEKLLRENEVMREKQVNLSMDLDNELKAHAESQRRLEELAASRSSDSARLAELLAKAASGEKELARMQKQQDALNATIGELNETILGLETELESRGNHHAAEIAGFETEIQSLNARLQENTKSAAQKAGQIETLTAELNEVRADKRIVLERLEALQAENLRDKQQLSAAFANFSQLNVLQASEHVMLDVQRHEAEELRRQVGNLEATVMKLAPYEQVYQSGKIRPGKRPPEQGKRELPKDSLPAGEAANGNGAGAHPATG